MDRSPRRTFPRRLLIGALLIALSTIAAWLFWDPLERFFTRHPASLPAFSAGAALIAAALAVILWMENAILQMRWRQRTRELTGLTALVDPPFWIDWLHQLPDPLEWVAAPFLRTHIGRNMRQDWRDGDFGEKASRYLLLLVASSALGWLVGHRIGGALLGSTLALLAPLLPRTMVRSRAESGRRRFGEQLPAALDSLASGLSAGLSFQQALEFAQGELPEPIGGEFARLSRRLSLGFPLEEALRGLHARRQHDEALALVVEGITLQRRFGGDMVKMLSDLSDLLRGRIELEREVRAVTTQGRLSGYIIGALVPVSAGLLLALNPRYVDVLFDTIIGQALVVIALVLQLAGWAIISRLIRFRY
jgi:tight adherence protein B